MADFVKSYDNLDPLFKAVVVMVMVVFSAMCIQIVSSLSCLSQ